MLKNIKVITRKEILKMNWLKELLEKEKDSQELEKQIAEKLKQEYVPKADYDAVVVAKNGLEGQIAQRDNDIKALKEGAKDNKDLQKKYDELQEKYKTDTQNLQKQYQNSRKNSAIDMEILKAKGKNTKAIKALLDMENITLKDDGTLDGLDLDSLKKSDGYLFEIEQTHREGIDSGVGSGYYSNQKDNQTGGIFSLFAQSARKAAGLSTERGN